MGKDFLKLKTDQKKLCMLVLCAGVIITIAMGAAAYRNTEIQNGCELPKNEAGGGSYEQEVVANVEGYEKIPVTILVEEQKLSEAEAKEVLEEAALLLDDLLRGENESLSCITGSLNFADSIPGTPVEVEWISKDFEYFYSDGSLREDVEFSEPVELKLSAILSCQEYVRDYETVITLLPKEKTREEQFAEFVEEAEKDGQEVLKLPTDYEGIAITWKKPMDDTFLFFFLLTVGAVVFLHFGGLRDKQEEKKARMEELEKDYAQLVSKFTMLLSAGLSVRNAWERIVRLYGTNHAQKSAVLEEMKQSLGEMQKGIPELEVYERFGQRTGLVHYKKLMSLFVSDKKRGSMNLLEAMEQEMLQAWEEQKRKTRQQGEKTGTKLLAPMMGMLAVVFIMILVPAFLSFQL